MRFYLLIILVFSCTSLWGKPINKAYIKKAIRPFMKESKIPGLAIALHANGQDMIFTFGYANKAKKSPITPETIFEIGSISKIFTNILLAQELAAGRMKLTDSINARIPGLAHNQKLQPITLEGLATHTSGLSFKASEACTTKPKAIAYLSGWKPIPHAKEWQYSNTGTELLRLVLEKATQKPLNELLRTRILQPLNMAPMGLEVPHAYQPHYAQCYDKQNKPASQWNHPFLQGSAALRASAPDMLNFLKAALDCPGTPPNIRRAMKLSQIPRYSMSDHIHYGLGWQINTLDEYGADSRLSMFKRYYAKKVKPATKQKCLMFDKTGTTHGFQTYIAAIPDKKVGMVVLTNRAFLNASSKMRQLCKEVLFKLNQGR